MTVLLLARTLKNKMLISLPYYNSLLPPVSLSLRTLSITAHPRISPWSMLSSATALSMPRPNTSMPRPYPWCCHCRWHCHCHWHSSEAHHGRYCVIIREYPHLSWNLCRCLLHPCDCYFKSRVPPRESSRTTGNTVHRTIFLSRFSSVMPECYMYNVKSSDTWNTCYASGW